MKNASCKLLLPAAMASRLGTAVLWVAVIALNGCFGQSQLSSSDSSTGGGNPGTGDANLCAGPRDPGRITIHRLNRAEYNNTVRDLLGDTTGPSRDFPVDDSGYGFDNIADVLSLSPLLMEKYQAAAEALINAAWDRDSASGGPYSVRVCDPNGNPGCGRQILARFARRAWRRPATSDELDRYVALTNVAAQQGDLAEVGVKLALQAVLVSPSFIYRIELDSDPQTRSAHAVNDYELATRLSYFLGSSTPDDELSSKADDGSLHQPTVLEQQVRRMLGDPKSFALQENFVGQWLYTRATDSVQPDSRLFPMFNDALRAAMRQETQLFVQSLISENRSILDLLDADYTYLNDRLADHYGFPRPGTAVAQRTSVAGSKRGGILTQASFLIATSQPNRTSPVKRGKWVLSQLLCTAPPPPPPNVPPLPEGSGSGSVRQRLEQHRTNPVCASCHSLMDPIGFGLENFDAIGQWRDQDVDGPIDASGVLPGDVSFNGEKQLASILRADPRLPTCVVRQVLTYALGRGLTDADQCAVDDMTRALKTRGSGFADLFAIVATSDAFTQRRGEPGANP